MRYLVVSVFGPGEINPVYETIGDPETCSIQVAEQRPGSPTEYYDYRFDAPVRQDSLDETVQLVSDLIASAVLATAGLQPALF